MADEAAQRPRVKAENNPWYLLANLYGQPTPGDAELRARNRTAWNRCMARALTEEARAVLLARKRHPSEELTPFSDEELYAIEGAFAERHRQAACTGDAAIPDPLASKVIDFSEVDFDNGFRADGCVFPVALHFERAAFARDADFRGATFSEGAAFEGAVFSGAAAFEGATFSRPAFFKGATFAREADFRGVTFSGKADFERATFAGEADFEGATFAGEADFEGATFAGEADFEGATFRSEISFVNAEMKSETSFEAADFSVAPPRFFGTKLHEGTVWRHVHWPDPPKGSRTAGRFVDAYERLKLEMDRLKKHDDELNFFAREMQCRSVLLGNWKLMELPVFRRRTVVLPRPASGFAISLYGILCDYGRSYTRPLCGLLATVAIGTLLFWYHLRWGHFGRAACLSFANTFGAFGFRRDFIDPNLVESLSGWLKVASAAQTIFGVVLLFFFGLAVRNRFRMK